MSLAVGRVSVQEGEGEGARKREGGESGGGNEAKEEVEEAPKMFVWKDTIRRAPNPSVQCFLKVDNQVGTPRSLTLSPFLKSHR